jgi:LysM repeat protein
MRKLLFFLMLLPGIGHGQKTEYDIAVVKYIVTYSQIAIQEMKVYKIPASITLAQGIFESNAGRSRLAVEANNHFGIKCHKEWTGDTFIQDDETKNECFRKYDNPYESFRDHSWFLTQRDRYKSLFLLDIKDYKGWAWGLKVAGYATNPKYPELLIKAIETYELFKFDDPDYAGTFSDSAGLSHDSLPAGNNKVSDKKFPPIPQHVISTINNLKLTHAIHGDTWDEISRVFEVPVRKLYRYNDLKKGAGLVPGQLVYLEKKRRKGASSRHTVKTGETMYTISQLNGIQLKRLYKLNDMKPGTPVRPDQKLILR